MYVYQTSYREMWGIYWMTYQTLYRDVEIAGDTYSALLNSFIEEYGVFKGYTLYVYLYIVKCMLKNSGDFNAHQETVFGVQKILLCMPGCVLIGTSEKGAVIVTNKFQNYPRKENRSGSVLHDLIF